MTYVLLMSTDNDIVHTGLDAAWNPIQSRSNWQTVQGHNIQIPNGAVIVVIAHGNGKEIGNKNPGQVDITPEACLSLIHENMANGANPGAIYISTCAEGIAEFAAGLKLAAEANNIWANTKMYGHENPIVGNVPSPASGEWTQIF